MVKSLFLKLALVLFLSQLEAKNTINILVTNPRTLSTAFETSIRARGDHKVLNEPCTNTVVEILKEPTYQSDSIIYESVKLMAYNYAKNDPVFLKEHIFMLKNQIFKDDSLFSDPDVIFTFLIRDPALSIESFITVINTMSDSIPMKRKIRMTDVAFCYEELFLLAEKHYAMRGTWPMVIDAEDLSNQPEEVIQAFCKHANIKFMEKALTWEENFSSSPWHSQVSNSKGFFKSKNEHNQSRFANTSKELVPDLERIYQKNKPFYEKLKAIKLKIEDEKLKSVIN